MDSTYLQILKLFIFLFTKKNNDLMKSKSHTIQSNEQKFPKVKQNRSDQDSLVLISRFPQKQLKQGYQIYILYQLIKQINMQNQYEEAVINPDLKLADALRYIHEKIIETLQNAASEDIDFNQLIGMIQTSSETENLYAQLSITLFDYYQMMLRKHFISMEEYTKLEILTQKLEEEVRGHIRTQQHLKIYVQGIDQRLRDVEKLKEQKLELENKIDLEVKKNKLREQKLIEKIQQLEINLYHTKKISNSNKQLRMESMSQQLTYPKQLKIKFEQGNHDKKVIKSSNIATNSLSYQNMIRQKLSLPHLSYKEITGDDKNITNKNNNGRTNKLHLYISRSQAPMRDQSLIHAKHELLKNMDLIYENKKKSSKQKLNFEDSHLVMK